VWLKGLAVGYSWVADGRRHDNECTPGNIGHKFTVWCFLWLVCGMFHGGFQ